MESTTTATVSYKELLRISRLMLEASEEEDWNTFYRIEVEREQLIQQLKTGNGQANVDDIKELLSIHNSLETIVLEQKQLAKTSLLAIQKGKKANHIYQS